MKRTVYFFVLFAVFVSGVLGHLLLRPTPPSEKFYTVTLKTDAVCALLLSSLPEAGEVLSLSGCRATLLSCEKEPHILYFRREGKLLSRPSTLSVCLSFTLRVAAHEQNDRLFLGTRGVSIGEKMPLSGQNFVISALFLGYEPSF